MKHRKLMIGAIAAVVAMAAVPFNAEAAWTGLRSFVCHRGNWNFDGLYGPYTTGAVRAFQEANGLTVDGLAGPETYRALGLKFRRPLHCGLGGNDVFLLQQTLAAEGYWYGGHGHGAKRVPAPRMLFTPRPTHTPAPMATASPGWVEPPVIFTPSPAPTASPEATTEPIPTEAPTSAPMVSPSPEAAPSPEMMPAAPANEPTVEVGVGTWFVPGNAGSLNYDFTFQRPVWTADAALWWGNWGLGGDLTVFNQTYATFKAAPYFQANTYMYDGLLKYRFDSGYYQVFGGYRGLGMADLNFGTLGLGMERPLLGDWLWLNAKAQAGYNFGSAYFLDGQAGLGLHFNPIAIDLGFRHLSLQSGSDPLFNINGPTANVRVRF